MTFLPDGAEVHTAGGPGTGGGATVLDLADRSDTPLKTVCGGVGNCTSCRVRVVSGDWPAGRIDHARLGPLVNQGWRLACQFVPRGPLTVERPPSMDPP
ncbi:MAG TPA: 2Fe-2S iron-sulfur cluster-binding protein [Gemmatimonadales bacterium]|nr:2Fe-2S iron-sulfur cluster-binding protein [Gemmatimonadales bacterium]